jgi:hypothetical protein
MRVLPEKSAGAVETPTGRFDARNLQLLTPFDRND